MGKLKDLLTEVENIFRQKEEEGLKFEEVDDDTHRQMLGRYIEEKGLKNSSEFDLDDWLKWKERKVVCDTRTPEQKNKELNMVISLQDIKDMTDEEADKLGVRHIKAMYYKQKLEEAGKLQYINDKAYDEMMNQYMEEKGLTELSEIVPKDFEEWLDQKSHHYFKQEYGEEPEDVHGLYNIYIYIGQILYRKRMRTTKHKPIKISTSGVRRQKIPIPLKLAQFIKHQAQQRQ